MRSLWLLYELNLPFELVEMPFDLASLRSPDYLQVHPLGRVPYLMDGTLRLFESGAITEYLCEQYPQAALGRLTGNVERYEWLQWIHYSETTAVHAATLVQQHLFVKNSDRSEMVLNLEGRRLKKCVELLENHLRDREYLLKSGFSAADICVGYSIHLAYRFVDLSNQPFVSKYYDLLQNRPSFKASLPNGWRQPLSWLPDNA